VLYELLTGEPARATASLADLGATGAFDLPDFGGRGGSAPPDLVDAVTACLAVRPEDRPPSAAALARRLAPVASEAETLSLPADPSRRATEILAPSSRAATRRWTTRRLAAAGALAAAALAGLVIALALSAGGNAPRPSSGSPAVAPPAVGTNAAEQARNLAAWLSKH
jgi:hypothetical protein